LGTDAASAPAKRCLSMGLFLMATDLSMNR
jgi:hypothetical protein